MMDDLVKKLHNCNKIEALALGGSRATNTHDEKSDYDFYVYLKEPLEEIERRNLLDEFVCYMEYSNKFWELEDDGTLTNGIDIEFIYRELENMELSMENLLVKGNVGMGYTTCFVDNLLNSKVLFDKNNRLTIMREKYGKLLTNEFYDKIIYNNIPLLMDKMPSLYYQIEKALNRNDIFSINHRSTAFFEMYFDVLYALNRKTHPGEKRLLETASKLEITPKDMKEDITNYFNNLHGDKSISIKKLNKIVLDIYNLLRNKGYDFTIDSYKIKR